MDLQWKELTSRQSSREFVLGMAQCVEKDSPASEAVKMECQGIEDSGPLRSVHDQTLLIQVIAYCTKDLFMMPRLLEVYNTKLPPPGMMFRRALVGEAIKQQSTRSVYLKARSTIGMEGKLEIESANGGARRTSIGFL
jgi:hypothetical protein